MIDEPTITVNGVLLTKAQAMTCRVALQSFGLSLESEGLGDDEHGKTMTLHYLMCINDINRIMAKK